MSHRKYNKYHPTYCALWRRNSLDGKLVPEGIGYWFLQITPRNRFHISNAKVASSLALLGDISNSLIYQRKCTGALWRCSYLQALYGNTVQYWDVKCVGCVGRNGFACLFVCLGDAWIWQYCWWWAPKRYSAPYAQFASQFSTSKLFYHLSLTCAGVTGDIVAWNGREGFDN